MIQKNSYILGVSLFFLSVSCDSGTDGVCLAPRRYTANYELKSIDYKLEGDSLIVSQHIETDDTLTETYLMHLEGCFKNDDTINFCFTTEALEFGKDKLKGKLIFHTLKRTVGFGVMDEKEFFETLSRRIDEKDFHIRIFIYPYDGMVFRRDSSLVTESVMNIWSEVVNIKTYEQIKIDTSERYHMSFPEIENHGKRWFKENFIKM